MNLKVQLVYKFIFYKNSNILLEKPLYEDVKESVVYFFALLDSAKYVIQF